MRSCTDPSRRRLLQQLALGAGLPLLAPRAHAAGAASLPLLSPGDPAAQATQYVADARQAKGAQPGASCANCSLYGMVSATAGTCSLFPSNLVAAAGWCNAWSGL